MSNKTTLRQRSDFADGWLHLVVLVEHGGVQHHALPANGAVTIGRSDDCDVFVDEPAISRRHARLHLGPHLAIEDLGSANGTKIAGVALPSGRPARIAPNQPIDLGGVLAVVQTRPRAAPDFFDAATFIAEDAPEPTTDLERLAERVAAGEINVLILGETGVGKEVMAERIHAMSPRAARPFLRLNCAALSEHLLESELFGHERGAFTGAIVAKPGLLETAEGGTVFLDEIGELLPGMQVKLLRVLEERKVRRVGAVASRAIDVRFVAATNRDLGADVASGRFREDLYYRLNGITLTIQPLRERLGELADLAREFADAAVSRANRPPVELRADALAVLHAHAWPGNIRELRNVIERGVLLAGDGPLLPEHLTVQPVARRAGSPTRIVPPPIAEPSSESAAGQAGQAIDALEHTAARLRRELADVERRRITAALASCAGNQSRAAELLGMPRRTLVAKLRQLAIARPRATSGRS